MACRSAGRLGRCTSYRFGKSSRAGQQLPQPDSRLARRRFDQHRPEQGHSRCHGCFLPSARWISSRLKKRHRTSRPSRSLTSRIQTDAWNAHGHMMSKWKSTEVTGAPMTEDYDQQSGPPMHAPPAITGPPVARRSPQRLVRGSATLARTAAPEKEPPSRLRSNQRPFGFLFFLIPNGCGFLQFPPATRGSGRRSRRAPVSRSLAPACLVHDRARWCGALRRSRRAGRSCRPVARIARPRLVHPPRASEWKA